MLLSSSSPLDNGNCDNNLIKSKLTLKDVSLQDQIDALKLLNSILFPIKYTEKFYKHLKTDQSFGRIGKDQTKLV